MTEPRKLDKMKAAAARGKAKKPPNGQVYRASHLKPPEIVYQCSHTEPVSNGLGRPCPTCARKGRSEKHARQEGREELPGYSMFVLIYHAGVKEWVGTLKTPDGQVFTSAGFPLDRVCRDLGRQCRAALAGGES